MSCEMPVCLFVCLIGCVIMHPEAVFMTEGGLLQEQTLSEVPKDKRTGKVILLLCPWFRTQTLDRQVHGHLWPEC